MGGCRCTFRDCPNNSGNSPGMHFFHFPHKDPERCAKWALYSGNPHFLSLEVSKLRNKVVCEYHFRDECFMNYKKGRLVQQAIPTLVRLSGNKVLDYEESANPQPKYLSPTNLQHLIPPQSQPASIQLSTVKCLEPSYQSLDDAKSEAPPAKKIKFQTPRILNVEAPQNIVSYEPRMKINPSPTFVLEAVSEADEVEMDFEQVIDEETVECGTSLPPEPAPETVLKSVHDEKIADLLKQIEDLKLELEQKTTQVVESEAEVQRLKEEVTGFDIKPVLAVTQVETITTSKRTDAPVGVAPTLTKAQLFNGVKKYLNPSICAMVRMEMFGGPEREWKQDEKFVSLELFNLGEHIYNFVRDEWRCRLPSKREVEQWLSQRNQLEDEEDP